MAPGHSRNAFPKESEMTDEGRKPLWLVIMFCPREWHHTRSGLCKNFNRELRGTGNFPLFHSRGWTRCLQNFWSQEQQVSQEYKCTDEQQTLPRPELTPFSPNGGQAGVNMNRGSKKKCWNDAKILNLRDWILKILPSHYTFCLCSPTYFPSLFQNHVFVPSGSETYKPAHTLVMSMEQFPISYILSGKDWVTSSNFTPRMLIPCQESLPPKSNVEPPPL